MKNRFLKISTSGALFLISVILVLNSCKKDENPIKYPLGTFPDSVYFLTGLNSEYDDYNSNLPVISYQAPIIFSSNRNSSGNQFDLVQGFISYQFDQTNGNFSVSGTMTQDIFYSAIAEESSTSEDDLGPYSRFNSADDYEYMMVTTRTLGEQLDNYFMKHFPKFGDYEPVVEGPYPVTLLNSASNDSYISFDTNADSVYFCSDRTGNYDIYVHTKNNSLNLDAWLGSEFEESVSLEGINSSSNDNCPYFYKNVLIFASDRPGGLGGYDLYYSVLKNGEWSTPANMGININTSSDEFRPVISYHPSYTNKCIVFSSNRPGGPGGFDLYFTGYSFPK